MHDASNSIDMEVTLNEKSNLERLGRIYYCFSDDFFLMLIK